MILKLGTKLYNAAKKAYPINLSWKSLQPSNIKFSLNNPYILETLPTSRFEELSIFEGKKLKTVCRILDNPDYPNILTRYKNITQTKGFNKQELQNLYRKAFPNTKIPNDINTDAFVYLNGLPPEIGSKFDAHGLAKVNVPSQLEQLNDLLTKGIDKKRKFHTAPLVANCPEGVGAGLGSSGSAYRTGSFIVVGDPSKLIEESGIKHVIVNDAYYNIIDDLRKRFPQVGFVRADEAVNYFKNLLP